MPPHPYTPGYQYNSDEAYIERLEKHFAAYRKNHLWTGHTVHPILMRVKYGPHYDPSRGTPNEVRDRMALKHAVAQNHRTPALGRGIDDALQGRDLGLSKDYSADRRLAIEKIFQMLNVEIAGGDALNLTEGRDHDLTEHPKTSVPPEHVESYTDISSASSSSAQALEGGIPLRHEFMHRREQHLPPLNPLPGQSDPNFSDRSDPRLATKADELYTGVNMLRERWDLASYENARLDPITGVRHEHARPPGNVKQPALESSPDEKLKLSIDEIHDSFNTSIDDLRKHFDAKFTSLKGNQELEK